MITGSCHCGQVRWTFNGLPDSATACNCTICRRYGALWAYDYDGAAITVSGPTRVYATGEKAIGFHFCGECGCIAYWRAFAPDAEGRTRIAVNLRLSDPASVADITIEHFDGLDKFTDLGPDGRKVWDMWF